MEPAARQEWELTKGTSRLGLRGVGGPKPIWKFIEATRAYVRKKSLKGIDWWRYRTVILEPLLIPFTKKCNVKQLLSGKLPMLVQEDKAPAHASKYQDEVFQLHDILRLLWPGNSPDMNMIEPCWPWMKRITTKKGAPRTRKDAEKRWQKVWDELPQEKIQAWIERMPRHLRIIRFLKGDNKYKEGRIDGRTDKKEGKNVLQNL